MRTMGHHSSVLYKKMSKREIWDLNYMLYKNYNKKLKHTRDFIHIIKILGVFLNNLFKINYS